MQRAASQATASCSRRRLVLPLRRSSCTVSGARPVALLAGALRRWRALSGARGPLERVELLRDLRVLADQAAERLEIGQLVADRHDAESFLRLVRDPDRSLGWRRQLRARISSRKVFESARLQITIRATVIPLAVASPGAP